MIVRVVLDMNEVCPITNFTEEQQKRWPNLHKSLIGQLELPTAAEIPSDAMAQLDNDVNEMLRKQFEHNKRDRSREKLFVFLKQILEWKEYHLI